MTCHHASFFVSQLKQLTVLNDQALKLVNKCLDRALRYTALKMRIMKMDLRTLYISTKLDTFLANSLDLSSQISVLVMFRNLLVNAALCQYLSRKC